MAKELGEQNQQTITVAGMFFATLIAFGLQHLLDLKESDGPELSKNRWLCFILAILLVLRYLFGSAHHLWYEHVKRASEQTPKYYLAFDLGFLIVFGIESSYLCYADSEASFLSRMLWLPATAWLWGWLCLTVRSKSAGSWHFSRINTAAILVLIGAVVLNRHCSISVPILGWNLVLLILAPMFLLLLIWDFWEQQKSMAAVVTDAHQPSPHTR